MSRVLYCSNCGTQHGEAEAFCAECGSPTETAPEATPVAPEMTDASSFAPAAPVAPVESILPYDTTMPYTAPKAKGQRIPKVALAAIGGVAVLAIIIAVVALVFTSGRSNPIVGTWEYVAEDSAWRTRWIYNRDGTGQAFEVNVDTGMTRDEISFTWSTSRDFTELVRLEYPNPASPDNPHIEWFTFTITINAIGYEFINIRDVHGHGEWVSLRRIQ